MKRTALLLSLPLALSVSGCEKPQDISETPPANNTPGIDLDQYRLEQMREKQAFILKNQDEINRQKALSFNDFYQLTKQCWRSESRPDNTCKATNIIAPTRLQEEVNSVLQAHSGKDLENYAKTVCSAVPAQTAYCEVAMKALKTNL